MNGSSSIMKEFRVRCLLYHMRVYRGNINKELDNEPLEMPNTSDMIYRLSMTMSVRARFLSFKGFGEKLSDCLMDKSILCAIA